MASSTAAVLPQRSSRLRYFASRVSSLLASGAGSSHARKLCHCAETLACSLHASSQRASSEQHNEQIGPE